jgi:hypothetical protein
VKAKNTSRAASPKANTNPAPGASPERVAADFLATPRQATLFEMAPESDLSDLIKLSCDLAGFEPGLLGLIGRDLDTHALDKKRKRLDHRRWVAEQTGTLLDVPAESSAPVVLDTGRPRIDPLCALVFLMLRGWLGGCKDERFRTARRESISLRIFLENIGSKMPSGSSLGENLNAISAETLAAIHRAGLAMALGEGLDDFSVLRIDSTDTRSASAYPTDSSTITKLACRMCQRLGKLPRLGLGPCGAAGLVEIEGELRKLNYRISTLTSSSAKQAEAAAREEADNGTPEPPGNKGEKSNGAVTESAKVRLRRELYEELYALAEDSLPAIEAAFATARAEIGAQGAPPEVQRRREAFVAEFEADLDDLGRAIEQSRRRVCEGKKPRVALGMPLGVSDRDASFIEKGSWERTFGYRPQIDFSGRNLITALIVPMGNAPDQGEFIVAVNESISNTGVVPGMVTVDDGYTGAAQLEGAQALGVELVSFSGARGKALLGDEKWESESYSEARRLRNGAESGIYVLKKKVGFEQLAACGQERVRAELMEKVLAYNALKIAELRRRKRKAEEDAMRANREAA